jgi:hypothetical protein
MRWIALVLLTTGCSFGLGEERHFHARLAHVESAEVEGIATRLGQALEGAIPILPDGEGDASAEAPVNPSLREELALGLDEIRERASRTRFRCAMFEADHKRRESRAWRDVEPGSPEDKAHQAAYASMVYGNAMTAQVKAELYAKLAADLAAGVARVGVEMTRRLPWWMRWGLYLAVAGAAAYGLLVLVGAYAVAVRRIARRRRIAFEQLDDEVEAVLPATARRAIALGPEGRTEHAAINARRKKEGKR